MTKGTITNRLFLAPRIFDPYSENKAVPRYQLPQKSPVHHLKETGNDTKQNERKKRGRSLQILTDSGLKHRELLEQSTLASWSPAQRKRHRDGRQVTSHRPESRCLHAGNPGGEESESRFGRGSCT